MSMHFAELSQIKSKAVTSWSLRKKKEGIFVSFMLSEEYFFNICVLSQYIVYWIYFQNIHTFIYQKSLLHPRFCLFLKSPKAFSVPLRNIYFKEHLSMAASAFFLRMLHFRNFIYFISLFKLSFYCVFH